MRRSRFHWRIVPLAVSLLAAASAPAHAQSVLKRIKENAAKKIETRKTAAEDSMVVTADKMVDSTVEKTGRGVDATVTKVGVVVDTVLNRTERGVASVAGALAGGDDDALAEELAAGRAVVRDLAWRAGTAELEPSAESIVKRIVRAIEGTESVYLIEAHTEDTGDPAADQALSVARANAVKAQLVAHGIPAGRLFSVGLGATRPPTDEGVAARIELVKMQ